MKSRIKEIRKEFNLNQEEFGKRIGAKQSTITAYECGNRIPMDVTITSICKEFGINEKWLRTGEGEMKASRTRNQELTDMFEDVAERPDTAKARLLAAMSKLSDDQWVELADLIQNLANGMK